MKNKNPFHCFPFEKTGDGRQYSPSSQRNGRYILDVLKKVLPKEGTVLEIASGTGEHAAFFAPEFSHLTWQPSDPADDKIESIKAWIAIIPSPNLLPPIAIDAASDQWPVENQKVTPPITAIVCINMIHVSPWAAGQGLIAAAGRILKKGGVLYFYGAYMIDGHHTAPSNVEFDKMIRKTDSRWGLRDIRDVEKEANKQGLILKDVIPMPANNFSVVFEKE